ncbi:MAG TPA: hydroxymyristoyl-ACP dehydratase [Clostridiales bacterium]|jgi:hypothetical protein|nr:hydroxymyristoyl-ACP dehydratase [Clostridiaceae bacterium]HOQ08159.1 hydroxymyristoyl-ACP dehydratase [Clostridiales bacterium]HPV02744.1 hydroxymyristoyl-ACP dehydratase [Clostridiales bacterium]
MTTINCSLNCRHQKDGRCTLEDAACDTLSTDTDCVFFEEKTDRTGSQASSRPSE